jgi:hypothetical protein
MATSTIELQVLVDRARNGTPAGEGWGIYQNVFCFECGAIWIQVAMMGTRGKACPYCGHFDPDYTWRPEWTGIGGDGVYLNPVGWVGAEIILN